MLEPSCEAPLVMIMLVQASAVATEPMKAPTRAISLKSLFIDVVLGYYLLISFHTI
jgi:hypothetical protein